MEGQTQVVDLNQPTPTPAPAQAAPKPPETPPAPTKDATEEQNAARFAAIAKRERQIRQQQQQFKQMQQQFAKQQAEFQRNRDEWETEFKNSPLEAIKKRGRSYEDLTNAALNDGKFKPETEIKDLRSEIQKWRDEQKQKEEQQKLSAQKQYEAQIKEAEDGFKYTLKGHISGNPEKYELSNRYDPDGDMAYRVVEESWNRQEAAYRRGTGPAPKILSKEEACDLVEQYYEAEIDKELNELPKTKRFQSKWASKFGTGAQTDQKGKPTSPTLNNGMNSSAAPILTTPSVDNDRMARALAALDSKRA